MHVPNYDAYNISDDGFWTTRDKVLALNIARPNIKVRPCDKDIQREIRDTQKKIKLVTAENSVLLAKKMQEATDVKKSLQDIIRRDQWYSSSGGNIQSNKLPIKRPLAVCGICYPSDVKCEKTSWLKQKNDGKDPLLCEPCAELIIIYLDKQQPEMCLRKHYFKVARYNAGYYGKISSRKCGSCNVNCNFSQC
jgi:hypothetical protein